MAGSLQARFMVGRFSPTRVVTRAISAMAVCGLALGLAAGPAAATPFTETIPDGRGTQIPGTYPAVGGTVVVLEGLNGNYYYQFVNPSTQFQGRTGSGTPAQFRGGVNGRPNTTFQLGPTQTLNCGPTACNTYFGGGIARGYVRLTARDGDACPGNFDQGNDLEFRLNGFTVGTFSNVPVERTNRTGTVSRGFENCFRNQGTNETSTGWYTITDPVLLGNILATGSTTPEVFDRDPNDNVWFFRDGNDATGTPEVAPGLTIEKLADRTSYATVGETINYTFNLRNVGSVQLNDIVVTDAQISGAVTCAANTLASGATTTCTGSHVVTQENIDEGQFANVATATANPTEGTLGPVRGELTLPGPAASPAATLVKTASPTAATAAGQTITYTYAVENTGNITLENVTVADAHGGAGTLSAVSPASVTLEPGDTQNFTATYEVQQADIDRQAPITNFATLIGTPRRGAFTPPSDDASVTVPTAAPALSLAKVSTTASFDAPGQTLGYDFTITNTGNVTLTAPISIADDRIGAINCPVPAGGIAPGDDLLCQATDTTTQADVDAGSVTNEATVTANGETSDPVIETVNAAQTRSLTLAKALTSGGPDFDAEGDTLTYSYTVTNTGNVSLGTITVADDVIDAAGGSVTCPALPAGGLTPNGTLVCTGSYAVTQDDVNAGGVTNTAVATGDGETSNPSSVTVPAAQVSALSVAKSARQTAPSDFVVGGTIDYDYTVTNAGNVTATDPVTITDDRIPSVTCAALPAGGLLPGATLACTGQYTITSADVAFGSVTNIASATSGGTTSPQVSATIPNNATPALTIVKSATQASVSAVGETIDYTFTVTNSGDAAFVADVVVNDDRIAENPLTCFTPTPGDLDFRSNEVAVCTGTYAVTQADLDAGSIVNEATASTVSAGAPVTSDPATATVPVTRTPDFTLTKTADVTSFSDVNDSITYTLAVENTGNQTLTDVAITDPLLPSLSCTIATLAPGASDNSCTGTYAVTRADVDAGTVDNIATATARDGLNNILTRTGNASVPGPAAAPALTLAKSSASTITAAGQVATFDFTLRNTGNVSIDNVVLSDALCDVAPQLTGGDVAPLGTILPGEEWTYTCDVTATQAQVDAGAVTNNASATGTPARGALTDPTASTSVLITPVVDVTFEKVRTGALPDPVRASDALTYAFRVVNNGNVTLTDVTLTDAGATVSGGPITLAPGEEDATTFTATRTLGQAEIDAGNVQNQATLSVTPPGGPPQNVSSDDPGTPTPGDPTATALPRAEGIEIIKAATLNDGPDNVAQAGETVTYNFTVTNTGNVTLTNVGVNDPGVVVIGGPITLQPGERDATTFSATYTLLQSDVDAGQFENQATATGSLPGGGTVSDLSDSDRLTDGPGADDPTVVILGPDPRLELIKTSSFDDGGDGVQVGDLITYTLTVTNTGNVTINNTVVTDPLTGLDTSASPIVTLAPDESVTLPAETYPITQDDIDRGFVENSAEAEGTDATPNGEAVVDASDDPADPTSGQDPTVTPIPRTPGVAVVKVGTLDDGGDGRADAGDAIDYTFTVTNTGETRLRNATVSDAKLTVPGSIALLEPGASDTLTARYTLTQADIDAGTFENTATVTASDPAGDPVTDVSGTANGNDTPTVTSLAADGTITLVKRALPLTRTPPQAGDTITYAFDVTNTGNVTLTNVAVTDPGTTVSGTIATLAPGATDSTSVIATHVLTQPEINSGSFSNTATATGDLPGGGQASDVSGTAGNNDDPTVVPLDADGALTITKTADTAALSSPPLEGEEIRYSFTVTNTGNVDLTGVTVTDDDATVLGGPIALPVGASDTTSFTAVRVLTQADLDAGTFSNQATVSGNPPTGPPVTSTSDDPTTPAPGDPTVTALVRDPSIALVKAATLDDGGDGRADVGDAIDYAFTITNTGNVTVRDIAVTDSAVAVNGTAVTLAPGDSASGGTARYVLTQADIDAGRFTNTATATGTGPDGAPVTDVSDDDGSGTDDPTVVLLPGDAAIAVEKTADASLLSTPPQAGDTLRFNFTVRNTGNVTLSDVTIDDPNATVVGGPITLGENGEDSTSFIGTRRLTQADIDAGTFQNVAEGLARDPNDAPVSVPSDDPGTPDPLDPTTTPLGRAGSLTLVKTAALDDGGDGRADLGDTIDYTFTIRNTGNTTLTDIGVTDAIVAVPDRIATLAPSATAQLSGSYTLTQADLDAGARSNTATANGTNPDGTTASDVSGTAAGNDDPTVVPLAAAPSIELVKVGTLNDGGDGRADAGDAIDYVFTITNTGNVTVRDIDVADAGAVVSGGPITLAPGESSAAITGRRVLTPADVDAGFVTNTAVANGLDPSDTPVSDNSDDDGVGADDPTVTPLDAAPAIAIEKVATNVPSPATEGDEVTYAFTVRNTGNVTLTGITVDDPGATVSGGPITLAAGADDATTFTATRTLTQADIDAGTITNQASVSGTPAGGGSPATATSDDPATPAVGDPTITPLAPSPALTIEKVGTLNDGGDGRADVGDTIEYSFAVANTGNVTLTGVTVADPDATVSGGPITLAPGASDTATFTAVRVLTQADIDAGSFSNQATLTGTPPSGPPVTALSDDPATPDPSDPTVTDLPSDPVLTVEKTLADLSRLYPFVFEATYELRVVNDGNVTIADVTLEDDLAGALAPATLVSASIDAVEGATANPDFDGNADAAAIVPASLAPGEEITLTLLARFNTVGGVPAGGNTAVANGTGLAAPVSSDDPTRTPGDPTDTNPTLVEIVDSDGDGAPDGPESEVADRDGDGVPDAFDYDPTGYFYCQENGAILSGGLIGVTGPAGSQIGVGTSANINILRDGSDGAFQFFVTAPGRYRLDYTPPPTGAISTTRLPGAPLDLTGFLPTDPISLGSSEFGNTGELADFTEGANPFSLEFDIEAGDPTLLNVNIPLQFCTAPQLTASKSVAGEPTVLADGRTRVAFEIAIENTGLTPVREVSLADDLAAAFAPGTAEVESVSIANAGGATLALDPAYDGLGATELLATGQTLEPGDSATVALTVDVSVPATGTYTNTAVAGGASPLDGSPIPTSAGSADVRVVAPAEQPPLVVTKATPFASARLGDRVPYVITVENTSTIDRIGVDFVDIIPTGFTYVPGSASIDGTAVEPARSGRRLVWSGRDVAAGETVTLELTLGVGAAATGTEFVNRAQAEDPADGALISNVARAVLRREIEHVFDCGEIIGKVFDDVNRNGYQDEGEPGIPGARVATVRGLLVTTDEHGRFSVACADVPDLEIGSNFIMKLDKRSLPSGYRLTTENPRVVRLTRGKLTKLNFGVALTDAVSIDLDARAFWGTTTKPEPALDKGLDTLIGVLRERRDPAVTIRYREDGRPELSKARVRMIRDILHERWKRDGGRGRLDIETRVEGGR